MIVSRVGEARAAPRDTFTFLEDGMFARSLRSSRRPRPGSVADLTVIASVAGSRLAPGVLAFGLALALLTAAPSFAATPPSGTLDNAHPTVTWTGSIHGAGSGENTCVDRVSCD